jgi:hypothetical protein
VTPLFQYQHPVTNRGMLSRKHSPLEASTNYDYVVVETSFSNMSLSNPPFN